MSIIRSIIDVSQNQSIRTATVDESGKHSQELEELGDALQKVEQLREKNLSSIELNSTEDISQIRIRKLEFINPSPKKARTQNLEPLGSSFDTPFNPDLSAKPRTLVPPPTPRKHSNKRANQSPFWNIHQSALSSRMTIGDKAVQVEYFASGSYMNVYTLQSDTQIIPGISNEHLILKIYNEDKAKFSERKLVEYMTSSIENYHEATQLGLLVATIYNIDTALKDRFLLQEKVPFAVELTDQDHIDQIRHFFKIAFRNQAIFDLLPQNFRVREDGNVVLIDFVEQKEDGFDIFIRHAIKLWCKAFAKQNHQNKDLTAQALERFTEGFGELGYDLSWNQRFLDNLFLEVKLPILKA